MTETTAGLHVLVPSTIECKPPGLTADKRLCPVRQSFPTSSKGTFRGEKVSMENSNLVGWPLAGGRTKVTDEILSFTHLPANAKTQAAPLDTAPMEWQPAVTLAVQGKSRSSSRSCEAVPYAESGFGS